MTDEAMEMAADAPAVSEPQETTEAPHAEPTPRNAIDRAFEALDQQEEAPVEQIEGQPRTPDGKFAPKDAAESSEKPQEEKAEVETDSDPKEEPTTFSEAPKRFSADAKEAWKTAPEPVRAEITRAIEELEGGINQYREAFEPFREFDKQLKANGQDFQTVLAHYTGIEQMLSQNPVQGLDQIVNNLHQAGLVEHGTLREFAAAIANQPADQGSVQQDQTIRELRNEIAALKQDLGGVSNTIKSQSEQAALQEVQKFAQDKPRFDELSEDIAFFVQTGRAKDLASAYDLAERLNPAPQPTPPLPAQTRKNLSLSGAPSPGSNPTTRKTPSSAREALDNAFDSVGL